MSQRYEAERLNEFAPFVVIPMLVFFGLPLVTPRARGQSTGFIAGALALVTHYAVLYVLARTVWPDIALGAGAIVAGALALGYAVLCATARTWGHPSGVIATSAPSPWPS